MVCRPCRVATIEFALVLGVAMRREYFVRLSPALKRRAKFTSSLRVENTFSELPEVCRRFQREVNHEAPLSQFETCPADCRCSCNSGNTIDKTRLSSTTCRVSGKEECN